MSAEVVMEFDYRLRRATEIDACKNCGGSFVHEHGNKQLCSPQCKKVWRSITHKLWLNRNSDNTKKYSKEYRQRANVKARQVFNRPPRPIVSCSVCTVMFVNIRGKAIYCSSKCRVFAYRARHNEKVKALARARYAADLEKARSKARIQYQKYKSERVMENRLRSARNRLKTSLRDFPLLLAAEEIRKDRKRQNYEKRLKVKRETRRLKYANDAEHRERILQKCRVYYQRKRTNDQD